MFLRYEVRKERKGEYEGWTRGRVTSREGRASTSAYSIYVSRFGLEGPTARSRPRVAHPCCPPRCSAQDCSLWRLSYSKQHGPSRAVLPCWPGHPTTGEDIRMCVLGDGYSATIVAFVADQNCSAVNAQMCIRPLSEVYCITTSYVTLKLW